MRGTGRAGKNENGFGRTRCSALRNGANKGRTSATQIPAFQVSAGLLSSARVAKLMPMSIKVTDMFARKPVAQDQELVYPAEFAFRVIVEAQEPGVEAALNAVLSGYKVTAPLAVSRSSSAGSYLAYGVSVEMQSPAELREFDAAVKRVPGVRMLL